MTTNNSKTAKVLYEFYIDYFIQSNKPNHTTTNLDKLNNFNILFLSKHLLFHKHLLNSSVYFTIQRNTNTDTDTIKNNTKNNSILLFNKIPIVTNQENYLFKYFLKLHYGVLEFQENMSYINNSNSSHTNLDNQIRNKITNNFIDCLNLNKKNININKEKEISIKNVCVKERLTLYNYLVNFNNNGSSSRSNHDLANIKEYINMQYTKVLGVTINKNKNNNKKRKDNCTDTPLNIQDIVSIV